MSRLMSIHLALYVLNARDHANRLRRCPRAACRDTRLMHPLYEHLARQFGDLLQKQRFVVVYDPKAEFEPFVARDLPRDDAASAMPGLERVRVGTVAAYLARYEGSYFGLRAAVEPIVSQDRPEPLLIYVPRAKPDEKSSPLTELERAGTTYAVQFKRLARTLLQRSYSDGQIDELLERPNLSYDDLAALLQQRGEHGEPPSVLRTIFDGLASEPLLTRWLADDAQDAGVDAKGAAGELARLIESRLGLAVPDGGSVSDARTQAARYLLVAEFRADLAGPPPPEVSRIQTVPTREHLGRIRDVLAALRRDHAEAYLQLADRAETDLRLATAAIDAAHLGSVDTFRFEEQRLLDHAATAITGGRYDEAFEVVTGRQRSFWVDRDLDRLARWTACRLMAALGQEIERAVFSMASVGNKADAWVAAYAVEDGWHRVDGVHRELESWVAHMEDDLDEASRKAHVHVGNAHDGLLKRMAEGFGKAFRAAGWTVPGLLHQTHVHTDVVRAATGQTAYIFVDALRYEMGAALVRLLEGSPDLAMRPAVAALPTITPVGMAALLPGAAESFSVVQQGSKLAARIDASTMTGLADRQKVMAARVPGVVDLTLDEVIQTSAIRLKKKIERAPLVVVRSQEIDMMGELGQDMLARRVMDAVIGDVARAIRKLGAAGVERFVVSADHGHLFARPREDDMKTDSPGGDTLDLHRRCWIGRGGADPMGTVRVSAATLGYASDLDFVFPTGLGVFKAGGGLSYHHGGISLQELIVPPPVVTPAHRPPAPRPPRRRPAGSPGREWRRNWSSNV